MKLKNRLNILLMIMLMIGYGFGCGDERSDRLPTDDVVQVFPQVYDLSNPNMPYAIFIEFSPFNYLGNPYEEGTGFFIVNGGAEGYLALDEESGPSISFDFEDGVAECWYVPSNAEEIVTVYVAAGAYPYDIIASTQIYITNQVLDAKFTYEATGLSAYFFNSSVPNSGVNPAVLTYSWDFGDGSAVSTAENPSHTYAAAGTYRVELTVTEGAQTVYITQNVKVVAAP